MRTRLPLRRLDAALAREVLRLRARYQLSLDEFRGLYVSDEQVDALLARSEAMAPPAVALPPPEPHPGLDPVVARFALEPAAADILLLALAPEIDPAYPPLFAYLNDDVRRRWPTIDLARRLFRDPNACAVALAADGPLFGPGLLLPLDTADARTPQPLLEFIANPVLAAHLLGAPVTRRPGVRLERPTGGAVPEPLAWLAEPVASGVNPLVVLTGHRSDDRTAAVHSLAHQLGRSVVRLTPPADTPHAPLLRDGVLAARLADALLLVEADTAALSAMAPGLRDPPVPVFLRAPEDGAWRLALSGLPAVEVAFPLPPPATRRRLWADAMQAAGLPAEPAALDEVSERYRLSVGQIAAAAASIRMARAAQLEEHAGTALLMDAARHQAGAELGNLAQRVAPGHGWDDLVLPASSLRQLRQLGGAIRHRERVFGTWGFSGGPGVTALFSGSPGTGKSMTAGVLAREAGLDLWRIDLSSVVSKYIGETEKQLDRIFALARDGNAILFFDEADALFGKRSEVKDAHDRYANIEVAFLLQRLETFDGVALLASNLARNVDQAFSRRMHFVIEFPLPDVALRERLWRAAIPPTAPLSADADLGFLARQFAFAGGDIKVAVLDAAFAAAAEDAPIDMARLCQAVSRQLLKQGKVPSASDFRPYQLAQPETLPRPRAAAE